MVLAPRSFAWIKNETWGGENCFKLEGSLKPEGNKSEDKHKIIKKVWVSFMTQEGTNNAYNVCAKKVGRVGKNAVQHHRGIALQLTRTTLNMGTSLMVRGSYLQIFPTIYDQQDHLNRCLTRHLSKKNCLRGLLILWSKMDREKGAGMPMPTKARGRVNQPRFIFMFILVKKSSCHC